MKCEDAAESLSALCDGEQIAADAAEHLGACDICCARLQQYLSMGAELRRVAGLEPQQEPVTHTWKKIQRPTPTWWAKGWETMRIPRFAFVSAVLVIAALTSSLVMITARAHTQGSILLLTAKAPTGENIRCALSGVDQKWASCAWLNPPQFLLGFRVISMSGDQILLGVRAKSSGTKPSAGTYSASIQDLDPIPEKQYWFRPGEKLEVDVPQWGALVLTGELTDHIPPLVSSGDMEMDPKPGELRIVSPLLLRGETVLHDFEGGTAIEGEQEVVRMYVPEQGLWVLSLRPMQGAVQGRINLNRVLFQLDGQSYSIVTGTPVARAQQIWILHDANYRPDLNAQNAFIGGGAGLPSH